MLVLHRKKGETVMINDDITVTYLGEKDGVIRLGFKAPSQTKIHREEVYRRIQRSIAINHAVTRREVELSRRKTGESQ